MTTYTASTTVTQHVGDTYDFVKDPTNLPHYFPRVTKAELVEPELVRTTAVVDADRDGSDEPVTSDAWFTHDDDAHAISWGSPESDYRGGLELTEGADGTTIELSITTVHDIPDVQQGLEESLAAIARRLEEISAG
ncbi:SRPBCC family protein [Phycicoccus duodecadis]|uniref:Polyketide cyclase/dehydrase/lipid transport protein n=1 Tax=Phycicoccus duodecadis TaxID=173053 RepID=A0A2N3YI99_9MICO|nr:SRPBCC family protein [Phycicoccus duodecadis]PKW26565.1 polyketide cyclase/dehydrase/lipid transport protein [Phycicoccus duodecadis]